ncbi:Uncharacterized protein BP5553_07025 [Venustampulla echinocandica]|uniref:Uncharacterized protein n=1 Tax=Venustampulla echinocandica TaxID=2656787 RepID=A0A370TIB3_9HELO|nr:Uncharacterized protein BP5553_07025 [Venustampulla echinocandica]RDL35094.1 Uncharacterized protein BP5553_07025 [Venustampulla echinocandica]
MSSKSQSRRSSASKMSSHRPELMRASATAPSLATSNASRQDLASLQSSRATAILTRVAGYSVCHDHPHHGSPSSICSSPSRSPGSSSMEARKEPYEIAYNNSSNYFSFPSFEDFQEYQESHDTIDGRGEKGVP